jgi:hypothetical protein
MKLLPSLHAPRASWGIRAAVGRSGGRGTAKGKARPRGALQDRTLRLCRHGCRIRPCWADVLPPTLALTLARARLAMPAAGSSRRMRCGHPCPLLGACPVSPPEGQGCDGRIRRSSSGPIVALMLAPILARSRHGGPRPAPGLQVARSMGFSFVRTTDPGPQGPASACRDAGCRPRRQPSSSRNGRQASPRALYCCIA